MPVPDYSPLMLSVLRALLDGEVRIGELVSRVDDDLHLTSDDRAALLSSGRQSAVANRIHWAKVYQTKADLVEATRRGHSGSTPRCNRQALASSPVRINTALLRFGEFRTFFERGNANRSHFGVERPESEAAPDEATGAPYPSDRYPLKEIPRPDQAARSA